MPVRVARLHPARMIPLPRLRLLLRVAPLAIVASARPAAAQDAVLLRNARVVDVAEARVTPRMSLLLRDGRVIALEPEGRLRATRGVRVMRRFSQDASLTPR